MTVYQKKVLVAGFWAANLSLAYLEVMMVVGGVLIWQLALSLAMFHLLPALVVTPMLKRAAEMPDPEPVKVTAQPPVVVPSEPEPPAKVAEPEPPIGNEPEPFVPLSPEERAARYRAAIFQGRDLARQQHEARQAAYQERLEAARVIVREWMQTRLPEVLREYARRGDHKVSLTYLKDPQLNRILGAKEDARLYTDYFLEAEGQAVAEAFLRDGFRLRVSGGHSFGWSNQTPTTWRDFYLACLERGFNVEVEWPHLSECP